MGTRLYLPTCTAKELERVFGPVDRFLLEDGSGELLEVSKREGRLEQARPTLVEVEEEPFPEFGSGLLED